MVNGKEKYRCSCGFGQMAKYSCNDGFVLVPKECKKIVCRWNQNWSGKDDPSCKAVQKKLLSRGAFLCAFQRFVQSMQRFVSRERFPKWLPPLSVQPKIEKDCFSDA